MEVVASHWTWMGLGASLLLIAYRYIRKLFFPCVTLLELEDALKCLETVYTKHIDLILALLDDEYYKLNIAASKLVEEHLRGSALWTYAGFHPRLMPKIARWYEQSEDARRKILTDPSLRLKQSHEQDNQSHLEAPETGYQAIISGYPTVTPQLTKTHFAPSLIIVLIPLRLSLKVCGSLQAAI
ncbi:hypothetical protein PQX77_013954 [Marasmius sp. AFHP31]|nr:hypothetical protein PQX77_013954 [Marasmius sp. AFHP31]